MDANEAAYHNGFDAALASSEEALTMLRERVAEMETVLRRIGECDAPRPVARSYRQDGKPSKQDICAHLRRMYEDCDECTAEYARSVLGK